MGQVLHHVILRDIGGKKRVILNWLRSHDPAFQHRRPFSPRLQDIRIVMEILLWRIMVAAAVDMVAFKTLCLQDIGQTVSIFQSNPGQVVKGTVRKDQ